MVDEHFSSSPEDTINAERVGAPMAGERVSASPEETMALGRDIGAALTGGEVIALEGPLGAGKTTMIKGIASALGVKDTGDVRSPTFVLQRTYPGVTSSGKNITIYHIDAYRLEAADLDEIGGREMFSDDGIVVVEWADRVVSGLPSERINIALEHTGPETRRIIVCQGTR